MVNYFDHVGKEPTGINNCKELLELLSALGLASSLPKTRLFAFIYLKRTRNIIIKNLKRLNLQSGGCYLVTDSALTQLLYGPQTYIETIYLSSEA